MTRNVTPEALAAASQRVVRPFFAVDLEFDSPNTLHFWSGIGNLTYAGTTYTGAGEFLQISEVRESSDISANGATLSLSGIPSDLVSLAVNEPYQGRTCRMKLGMIDNTLTEPGFLGIGGGDYLLLNTDGSRLSIAATAPATMFDLFAGYMDQMNITEGPETATIALAVESKMVDLDKPRLRRYTHNNQIARYSGDMAFEFVNRLQDEEMEWK